MILPVRLFGLTSLNWTGVVGLPYGSTEDLISPRLTLLAVVFGTSHKAPLPLCNSGCYRSCRAPVTWGRSLWASSNPACTHGDLGQTYTTVLHAAMRTEELAVERRARIVVVEDDVPSLVADVRRHK